MLPSNYYEILFHHTTTMNVSLAAQAINCINCYNRWDKTVYPQVGIKLEYPVMVEGEVCKATNFSIMELFILEWCLFCVQIFAIYFTALKQLLQATVFYQCVKWCSITAFNARLLTVPQNVQKHKIWLFIHVYEQSLHYSIYQI